MGLVFGTKCEGMGLVASELDLGEWNLWLAEPGLGLQSGLLGIGLRLSWDVVNFPESPGNVRHLQGLGSGGSFRHLPAAALHQWTLSVIAEDLTAQFPRGVRVGTRES